MKRSPLFAAFALLLTQTSACYMSPRLAGDLARAAIVTTVVAANVALLASHDAHYHWDGCGHHHHWRDGRVVYYYGGRWEYYDEYRSGWYYYAN